MCCNLRLPNIVLVVLGFNYKTHNAPSYKFNNMWSDHASVRDFNFHWAKSIIIFD